ncbi:hypothetical protein [Halomonas sp. BC2]|uniref:hypothetical protein n=1 Tax=Halomonas sp. BC2 TaxID=1670449 RepID=UPI0009BFBEE5|nr:hypothetical protein [Halomonas sp. BC2]
MSDAISSPRIVPDVDQSFTAQHLRHRKGPRLWPLWFFLMLLFLALAGASVLLWYEREELLRQVSRVSGEVSNLHARLDSGDTDAQDEITFVQAQMATLFQEQEQLAIALTTTREELYGLLTDHEASASSDALDSVSQQFERLQEQAAMRDNQLAAIRASLNALEQVGTSGRQNLLEEVSYLEQTFGQRLEELERQLASEQAALAEQQQWRVTMEQQLGQLSEVLEDDTSATFASQSELASLEAEWSQRLATLESDVRQVRQAQLAFSAQMEMLRN